MFMNVFQMSKSLRWKTFSQRWRSARQNGVSVFRRAVTKQRIIGYMTQKVWFPKQNVEYHCLGGFYILYSTTKAISVGKLGTTKTNIIFTFTIPVMLICFINSNAMVTIYLNWPTNYLADQHPISLADDSAWTNSHAWTFGEIEWKPQTREFLSNTMDMLAIP